MYLVHIKKCQNYVYLGENDVYMLFALWKVYINMYNVLLEILHYTLDNMT